MRTGCAGFVSNPSRVAEHDRAALRESEDTDP
jgi:hypothetical protein